MKLGMIGLGKMGANMAERLRRHGHEVLGADPTVADAAAAGYRLTTPYAPGLGPHFGKDADTQAPGEELDPRRPQSLLYAGTDPEAPIVGLMYVQLGGDEAPEGFVGPLDTWEPFPGQCLVPGTSDPVFPTKDSVTEEECDEAEGTFLDVTAWIQHVWVVPGWEAPGGVFAHANADIVCADALQWDGTGFDAVLLDAPCSATGTIRRHPDLPFVKDGSETAALINEEFAALAQVSRAIASRQSR